VKIIEHQKCTIACTVVYASKIMTITVFY